MDVPELVELPKGGFWMGGEAGDKFVTDVERPRHRVEIEAGVSLGRFPVTQHEFGQGGGLLPVVGVTWQEARGFARWVGEQVGGAGRLPTEAEWECAARAGRAFGEVPSMKEANFLYQEDGSRDGVGGLTEVGAYDLNNFGFGDLFGNVLEWVEDDWHSNHEDTPGNGEARLGGGGRKVVRGGGWDYLPRLLRPSWRDGLPMNRRQDNLGFRVAVDFKR